MAGIRLAEHMGGAQAPRRQALIRLRFGRTEVAATLVAATYVAVAALLVGRLGLAAPEALARTARLGTLWGGFDSTAVAFGFDRPPLLTLIALPFGAFSTLREHGLAGALATALTGGFAVQAAAGVAHRSGMTGWATAVFVAAFSLHPLLFFAGAVGLPETLYASLVLIALSQFGSWLHHDSVGAVIGAGVALGIAFLVRYDSILVSLAMGAAFWWVARSRARSRESDVAVATSLAFAVPVVFVVGLWTFIAWFPRGEVGAFVRLAAEVSRLGADNATLLAQMGDIVAHPAKGVLWVLRWSAIVAPLSIAAVSVLLALGMARRARADVAMALVSLAVLLPPLVSVALGHGQPLVTHLFATVVPAFAIVGYREQGVTGGVAPDVYETPRRRAQLGWSMLLLIGSVAAAGTLALLPDTSRPIAPLRDALRGQTEAAIDPDVATLARWIRGQVGPGGIVVDTNRHAEVMLATGDFSLFRTDSDRAEEATAYDPYQFATHVLTRRPLRGQGPGRIERPHPQMYAGTVTFVRLVLEAGDYRVYFVTGPALP